MWKTRTSTRSSSRDSEYRWSGIGRGESGRSAAVAVGGVLLLLWALGSAPGCGNNQREAHPQRRGNEIARVGEVYITEDDLGNLLAGAEGLPLTGEERRRFVERLVSTELLHQEALRRGLAEDPRIRSRLTELEREYLADHLLFLELRDRTRVTEREIEEYFNEHREEYLYEYRVSHILVNTLEEAEAAKAMLATKSFAWVANHHSIDPVAKRGGDLGYLTKGNMIPEFESVIFRMKPGETSDIVKSDFGYHIMRLVDVRDCAARVGLDDLRESIMNRLVIAKRESAYREYIDSLAAALGVEYYDWMLAPPAPSVSTIDSTAVLEPEDTTDWAGD